MTLLIRDMHSSSDDYFVLDSSHFIKSMVPQKSKAYINLVDKWLMYHVAIGHEVIDQGNTIV